MQTIFVLEVPELSSFCLVLLYVLSYSGLSFVVFLIRIIFLFTESCLHKTPKRSLSRKSRIRTFSSPVNDTDIQHEIFWDPHSPIAHRLGNINEIPTSGRLFGARSGSILKVLQFVEFLLSQLGCLGLFLLKPHKFFNIVLNWALILGHILELFDILHFINGIVLQFLIRLFVCFHRKWKNQTVYQ